MSQKSAVLLLYKQLLKESSKFSAYNYRMYAFRKIRDTFKKNKALDDPLKIQNQLQDGLKNLNIIKRQVLIGNLYSTDKLVIEK